MARSAHLPTPRSRTTRLPAPTALRLGLILLAVPLLAARAVAQQPAAPGSEQCRAVQEASRVAPDGRPLAEVFEALLAPDAAAKGAPETPPVDQDPRIAHTRAFERLLTRFAPESIFQGAPGGTTHLVFLVRPDGSFERVAVLRSSGFTDLDRASTRVLERVRLAPAVYQGCPVSAIGQMPFLWTPQAPRGPYGVPYGAQ
jgi:TonB family protein